MTKLRDASNFCDTIILLRKLIPKKKVRIAFLGYTDLMLNEAAWFKLGVNQSVLENRQNWEKLTKVHGRPDVTVVPTLTSALKALLGEDFSLTVFDFTKYEGTEIEWDFNFPIPKKYQGKFDIVLDGGTCEHIFNIAQALSNVNLMLSKNGVAWHGGPLCWPNHGFYGYNPTLFADFYEANACEILEMFLSATFVGDDGKGRTVTATVPKYERFTMAQLLNNNQNLLKLEFNLCTVVKKIKSNAAIIYPIQNKYRQKQDWV